MTLARQLGHAQFESIQSRSLRPVVCIGPQDQRTTGCTDRRISNRAQLRTTSGAHDMRDGVPRSGAKGVQPDAPFGAPAPAGRRRAGGAAKECTPQCAQARPRADLWWGAKPPEPRTDGEREPWCAVSEPGGTPTIAKRLLGRRTLAPNACIAGSLAGDTCAAGFPLTGVEARNSRNEGEGLGNNRRIRRVQRLENAVWRPAS